MLAGSERQLPLPNFPLGADKSSLRPIRTWLGRGYALPSCNITLAVIHRGTFGPDLVEQIIASVPYVTGIRVSQIETKDTPGRLNPRTVCVIPRAHITAQNLTDTEREMPVSRGWSGRTRSLGILSMADADDGTRVHIPMMLFQKGTDPDTVVRLFAGAYPGYVTDVGGENIQFWGSQLLPVLRWNQFLNYCDKQVRGSQKKFIERSKRNAYSVLVPFRSGQMNPIEPEVIRIIE